ncbi:MAG: helix-turn-helix domain-containing protein [Ruminococcaceae bacterium]|nr:helix-turn-helix domain-containing protein [Oscillospiraceae bacterium]
MAIIRADKTEGNYTQIANTAIRDSRLTGMATAVLLYMLSRPDDWQFNEKEIASHFSDGLRAVRSGIRVLIDCGYVTRSKKRKEGRFDGYEYTIYEQPTVMPFCENGKRENAKCENAKQHTTNNDYTKTEYTNIEVSNNNGGDNGDSPPANTHIYFSLKNIFNIEGLSKEIASFMEWYGRLFESIKGVEHPQLKLEQIKRVHDTIQQHFVGDIVMAIDNTDIELMKSSAILFFTRVKKSDHNINHFATSGILKTRDHEAQYQDIDESLYEL